MLFKDRQHAGRLLANLLEKYRDDPSTIIFGLPRGGVILAYEVAKHLSLPLDIICARKIGAPYNPEFGIGAITETGESFIDEEVIDRLDISTDYLQSEIKKESAEAARRLKVYRKNRSTLQLEDKTVILVDDGIATGATMKASIKSIRARKAKKIIVAVPVASPETLDEIRSMVDEVICLAAPVFFQAVGQFYENFSQTTDEEVIQSLEHF